MKLFLATIALLASGAAAHATDGLYITNNNADEATSNLVAASITGNNNSLHIDQTYDGLGLGNQVRLTISGDLNGGPLQSTFTGRAASSGLTAGSIVQVGHDNMVDLFIAGSSNLFASTQIGGANTLTAQMIGNYNQTAVYQTGVGNTASVIQSGNGNSLTIIQRSQ